MRKAGRLSYNGSFTNHSFTKQLGGTSSYFFAEMPDHPTLAAAWALIFANRTENDVLKRVRVVPARKNQKIKRKRKNQKKKKKERNENSSFKGGVRNVSMQTPDEVAEENLISYLPLIRPDPLN